MPNSIRPAFHPTLWLWPVAAAIFAVVACVVAWQKYHFMAAYRDAMRPTDRLYYSAHDQLFAWAFVQAIILGLALCVSWRWPSRPTVLAALFLFVSYFIISCFHI